MRALHRPGWRALAAVLAAFPACAAAQGALSTVSLDQLMATLRGVRHVEARYIEHRYLHALSTPLETRGTLRFDAPDRLEKAADPSASGSADRLTIHGDQLTIDRGGGKARVMLRLSEHQEIGILVGGIRATLSGDAAALRQVFDISLSGTLDEWQLTLRPHDPGQRKLMQWTRISGHGDRITAIDTEDPDGDRSAMSIVELKP